jgi:hypothetical protein
VSQGRLSRSAGTDAVIPVDPTLPVEERSSASDEPWGGGRPVGSHWRACLQQIFSGPPCWLIAGMGALP